MEQSPGSDTQGFAILELAQSLPSQGGKSKVEEVSVGGNILLSRIILWT